MTASLCGVTSRTLTAKAELARLDVKALVTVTRSLDTIWEACYYYITVDPSDNWRDNSYIYIYLNTATTATMNVYAGTDRRNATMVIQTNTTLTLGAPVRVKITDGAIVVLKVIGPKSSAGSASFSYKVVGT